MSMNMMLIGAGGSEAFNLNQGGNSSGTFGSYTIQAYTSTGNATFDFSGPATEFTILMVGGGGGGGFQVGGGGGGGGVLYGTKILSPGTYSLNIGGGGEGAHHTQYHAVNGQDTTGFSCTARGGGRGGNHSGGFTPDQGGSGGGGGCHGGWQNNDSQGAPGNQPDENGLLGYAYAGGNGKQGWSGGGGGGGGSNGSNSNNNGVGGPNGQGRDYSSVFGSTWGESGYFASGGWGCLNGSSDLSNTPAQGGGGYGAGDSNGTNREADKDGQANTGGGGGGTRDQSGHGGDGGSGIILIRYLTV